MYVFKIEIQPDNAPRAPIDVVVENTRFDKSVEAKPTMMEFNAAIFVSLMLAADP